MNYHLAKKHAPASSKQSTVCSSSEQEFPSYYSLQQHRRKEHGAKQRKMENGRNKVFNFQMSQLDTKIIREKKSSTSSILPQKSIKLWVLFFEILRLVNIDFSTLMKTILCLKNPTYFVRKRI